MRRSWMVAVGLVVACAWPAGLAVADPTPAGSPSAVATPDPSPTGSPTGSPTAVPDGSTSPTAPAESPDPTTGLPTATPGDTPGAPTGTPTTPSPSVTPSPSSTSSSAPGSTVRPPSTAVPRQAQSVSEVSLSVKAGATPQAGKFFEDIGYYAFSGAVDTDTADQRVEVWQYGADKKWRKVATTATNDDGNWSARLKVTDRGTQRFRATLGGSPTTAGVISSSEVGVTVNDASITMKVPPTKLDALKSARITGYVTPARAGVPVRLQARVGSDTTYRTQGAWTTTNADGFYAFTFSTGTGNLQKYGVRTLYLVANRHRYEISASQPITRVRVLNAVVTKTTAAEVAKTYRSGCPVGPSKLRTITMNFYGFDKKMHRGVIIVRSDLTGEIVRSFQESMDASYPIRKMKNPNVYGGSDPKQMAADNTSGFNCRKVVGNPYAQSPHSYGIAIDVNTVENPYRDANGKWWPSNGKKYIDRSPLKKGMLGLKSRLTKQLRHEGYFWGGLWSPGRDYQHFQYDR